MTASTKPDQQKIRKTTLPAETQDNAKAENKMTPMMAQYTEIKAANADCLLFYRMGDFYELFFEDAVTAAEALGIALTKRGKHLGEDIPMCGVPIHAADNYLQRLIKLGHRVAVCEQTEDPAEAKKRGAKAVVRREVVRLVTPGTLTEDNLLTSQSNNFLTSIFPYPSDKEAQELQIEKFALASIDISTGEFLITTCQGADLMGELIRLEPKEIVAGDDLLLDKNIEQSAHQAGATLTPIPQAYFDSIAGERDMKACLGVVTLDGFGTFDRAELAAIGATLKYIDVTQIGHKPAISPPKRSGGDTTMVIDAATRINLEIVRSTTGSKKGSLLGVVDRTVTGPGARLLATRLASPLTDPGQIAERLDAIEFFIERPELLDNLRTVLKSVPDIARALSRISLNRGTPRDLGALRDGLSLAQKIHTLFKDEKGGLLGTPQQIADNLERLSAPGDQLLTQLEAALNEDLPPNRRDGGFIRDGYRADLDENRLLRDETRTVISNLQGKYSEQTGVKSLKVRHNNVLGYFVEVTSLNAQALTDPPHQETFIHRQTLASAIRFTTTELSDLENKITRAADRAQAIEQEVFSQLVQSAIDEEPNLLHLAHALAECDVDASLAKLAKDEAFVRPTIDNGTGLLIEGGRHPVVEHSLKKSQTGPYIENDCQLGALPDGAIENDTKNNNQPKKNKNDATRILVVTGPNMAGKSTYLRQNALICILAQSGSYVPASSAHIGIVDRLFSRVGASDDLASGRSTFMVEMVETANILNRSSERSLVILDEIGRGTATFDGLSIAWATVEYLHETNRCRALFATHYHELTALANKLENAANATMEVKDWKDEIIFLHKVIPGCANRSYGIQVAKLAGLPASVTTRASEVLTLLEKSGDKISPDQMIDDLPLFSANRPTASLPTSNNPTPTDKMLKNVNPDELTPRQALDILYKLKALNTTKED